MASSYYKSNRGINQYKGVITKPCAGLNEYSPATSINDNYLSDVLDATGYREEAMYMYAKATAPTELLTGTGRDGIVWATAPIPDDRHTIFAYLVFNKTDSKWYIRRSRSTTAIYSYEITSYGFPTTSLADYYYSICSFSTEAVNYMCFICSGTKVLAYLDYTNARVGQVTLPFYPKKIISHTNRIFALDTGNKLWWCRAGDLFSWYGGEYDNDYIAAEQVMQNGALTITTQPNTTRLITFTHRSINLVDTLGSIALVGTDFESNAQSETITPVSNTRVISEKRYKTVTSATQSGWVQAGGATDYISIGVGPVGSKYVQADAGYWTIENEKILTDMCVLDGAIYLFGQESIYIFRGTSYETYDLKLIKSDMGIRSLSNYKQNILLASSSGIAYYINAGNIYEYNGNANPRLISHPEYKNNALTNGVMGGIATLTNGLYSIVSTEDDVYVYKDGLSVYTTNEYYRFNIPTRTWWKHSGLNNLGGATAYYIRFVPLYGNNTIYSIVSLDSAAGSWAMYLELGYKVTKDPYIITKAFNTNPSETGTLTAILLMLSGVADATSTIACYYSLTVSGDDFIAFKTYTARVWSGDVEILEIPVPVSYIANAHHYRIKIVISTAGYIYNLERRFRVRGYSR